MGYPTHQGDHIPGRWSYIHGVSTSGFMEGQGSDHSSPHSLNPVPTSAPDPASPGSAFRADRTYPHLAKRWHPAPAQVAHFATWLGWPNPLELLTPHDIRQVTGMGCHAPVPFTSINRIGLRFGPTEPVGYTVEWSTGVDLNELANRSEREGAARLVDPASIYHSWQRGAGGPTTPASGLGEQALWFDNGTSMVLAGAWVFCIFGGGLPRPHTEWLSQVVLSRLPRRPMR